MELQSLCFLAMLACGFQNADPLKFTKETPKAAPRRRRFAKQQ